MCAKGHAEATPRSRRGLLLPVAPQGSTCETSSWVWSPFNLCCRHADSCLRNPGNFGKIPRLVHCSVGGTSGKHALPEVGVWCLEIRSPIEPVYVTHQRGAPHTRGGGGVGAVGPLASISPWPLASPCFPQPPPNPEPPFYPGNHTPTPPPEAPVVRPLVIRQWAPGPQGAWMAAGGGVGGSLSLSHFTDEDLAPKGVLLPKVQGVPQALALG